MKSHQDIPLKILLAEDNQHDRYFFKKALNEIGIPAELTSVNDGDLLMKHLAKNLMNLPDILFLDLNMPCKNGFECLSEIKQDPALNGFPVVIFSTSYAR